MLWLFYPIVFILYAVYYSIAAFLLMHTTAVFVPINLVGSSYTISAAQNR